MTAYLLRRTLGSVALLWGVLTLSFALVHLAPGDPVDLMVDPTVPAEDAQRLRDRYGLDAPLPVQYLRWLGGILQGDLGVSLRQQRPVAELMGEALPNTLRLTLAALLLNYALGIGLGVLSAARRGSRLDRLATISSLTLYSMPTFWLALMAQLLFCYALRWLPSGGMPAVALDPGDPWPWVVAQWEHAVLPVVVLGASGAAGVARYVRGSMLEVLQQDHIRAARARGVPERTILWRHALRNAAIPLVTLAGLSLPFLLGGSVVIETIFSWPGMGRVAVEAIFARDYPVILAATMLSGALVIAGSWLADLGYALLDPRIRAR